ncbi:MAG TPA: hypothetical protein VMW29_02520 [Candidatus Bathyarchaeia archaeon]|nr:hypothetical protein [Candidatus Bathyarchaeia archaeon]
MSDSVKPTQVPGESAQISGVDLVLPSVQPSAIPPEPAWMGKDTSSSVPPVPEIPSTQPATGVPITPKQNLSEESSDTYPPSGGGKKILSSLGIVLGMILLASFSFFSLWFLSTKKTKETPKSQDTGASELTPAAEKNLQLGVGEKSEVTSWKNLTQDSTSISDEQKLDIAAKVLSWLDDQRDSRGVYIYGYRCVLEGDCGKQELSNQAGLTAIWGRFKYYEKAQSPSDLIIINKDLGLYSDENIVGAIQNNFWNCKLMYEMWQSNLFSQPQKDKIKKICDRGSYYSPEGLNSFDKVDFKTLLQQKPESTNSFQGLSSQGMKLVEYAAFASDFASKYAWEKDNDDLDKARLYFNGGVKLWSQEPKGSYVEGRCVLGVAALDLYEVTKEQDYLDFSQDFLEKEKISELATTSTAGTVTYFHNSLFEQATCGLFLKKLAVLAADEKYRETNNTLLGNLLSRLFTIPEYKNGTEGKGAFSTKTELSGQTLIERSVRENGLMVGLLVEK